jgi:hypothetical protein
MNYEFENNKEQPKYKILYNIKNKDLNNIQNPIKIDTTDYIVINNKLDKKIINDRNICSVCNIL